MDAAATDNISDGQDESLQVSHRKARVVEEGCVVKFIKMQKHKPKHDTRMKNSASKTPKKKMYARHAARRSRMPVNRLGTCARTRRRNPVSVRHAVRHSHIIC